MSNETEWVLVPREPTQAMLDAGHWPCVQGRGAKSVWATMLAASPQRPPAEAQRCTCPSGDGSLRWPCPAHPPEAQPAAWQFQDREGNWHGFINEQHRLNTIEDGSWPIRALYAHPPPSAPVGAKEAMERAAEEIERYSHAYITTIGASRVIRKHMAGLTSLAQQPAAVDGDNPYPAPRNRQEAAALAKLALAYLGVTSAHIDAVVARCETDLAAQQPAAVDGATRRNAERYCFLRNNNGVQNHHGVEIFIGGEAHAPGHLDAQVDAALAAQPGGSDNDR